MDGSTRRGAARPSGPHYRVVLTGGPAAGKTAVSEVLKRQLTDEVAVLPEMATLLFTAGYPRPSEPEGKKLVQRTIFTAQHNLEAIFEITHPDVTHVCDRGTLDGGAYWPGGAKRFLDAMGTSLEEQHARYDAVLFLETSAYGKEVYDAGSAIRVETAAQARAIDGRLRKLWEDHPRFFLVNHEARFYEKVAAVLIALHRALGVGQDEPRRPEAARKPNRKGRGKR